MCLKRATSGLVCCYGYHPDVSKHSQACELFKSVRHAYEILFNEVTRARYDFKKILAENGAHWERYNTLGSLSSLTFSSVMALFDRQLDAEYKIGYFIAWILGGRGGVLLVLCLHFASLASGKTSSSTVAPVAAAMCVGSNLARFAPLAQGALVTLLYMSIKLQADLN
ncbi:hypothetical protein POTOM_058072 [Populus tomentosa]|uniref:J domain-containing protein n=1 Tax=Populus tomentosa TaxID=118781 RepID=A0A8X7XY40_POPTO|nr:hypothetical protein POTOM_058072 [Populus tomentosa]